MRAALLNVLLLLSTTVGTSQAAVLGERATAPAKVSGTTFTINGKTQYFSGINAWYLGHLSSDTDVDTAISQIAKSGLKVIRVWGFGNANNPGDQPIYYQLLDTNKRTVTINYGTNGIPRLDAVIKYAEKYNVQLVLPFLNNWNDLGGINTYCAYFGCDGKSFYTNTQAQQAYQNYIKTIVNRYKNSPAIFAWELMNEPRCNGCDKSVITNWASKTSAYIKSLDSKHLVALGDEGWMCGGGDGTYPYSCGEGVDFEANLKIPTLDYGTFHLYPDSWGEPFSWGSTWISQHAALATKYNKPVVLEEYGISNSNSNRTNILKDWQSTVLKSKVAYDSYWQFATNLPSGSNPYDVNAIYYGTSDYQTLITKHASDMAAKVV